MFHKAWAWAVTRHCPFLPFLLPVWLAGVILPMAAIARSAPVPAGSLPMPEVKGLVSALRTLSFVIAKAAGTNSADILPLPILTQVIAAAISSRVHSCR